MKIVSDHGFPKGDLPGDDPFDRFKNERDYINQSGRMKTTVAAMDWAAAEIDRLRALSTDEAGGVQGSASLLPGMAHAVAFVTKIVATIGAEPNTADAKLMRDTGLDIRDALQDEAKKIAPTPPMDGGVQGDSE